ncbi:MAG: ATP-binding protein [Vampirovibrionales bacterium]|nr:ATP-binding protein [Vampirovibrionales bacterium]
MSEDTMLLFQRELDREKIARAHAEQLLEEKSRALYLANQLLNRITQMAAEADEFDAALQRAVELICYTACWPAGHVYVLDESTQKLSPSEIWHLRDSERSTLFKNAIQHSTLDSESLPGRVFTQGELLWSKNLLNDPHFAHKAEAGLIGLIGAIALPVKIESRVIAVMVFYTESEMSPNSALVETMASVSEQLSRVLERRDYQVSLKAANEALELKVQERTIELRKVNQQLAAELSERHKLEGQLVQSEKMASLGQLAAGVAHEINNPIGFVMSNLCTLSEYLQFFKQLLGYYDTLDALQDDAAQAAILRAKIEKFKAEEDIGFILEDLDAILGESKEGVERIKEIVQNLKSFSRVDETEQREANINECLETTLKIVWNELKYKCQIEKHYQTLPLLTCHAGQLNQVFMNLLVNAAQAMPEQGVIRISTRADATFIYIEIQDNGRGISPETLPQIFDPFFTTKPVGSGTGLGLSIVYGIIQKHQGDIDVKSELGQGTTFLIKLPLVQSAEKTAHSPYTLQEASQ